MTSGTFQSTLISAISVNRSGRQRKEIGDTIDLQQSLRRYGLIHPILITRESSELVVGERRLEAAKALGWTHINTQFEDQIDPIELKALEYEENIKRKNLPWVEEVSAIRDYHELKTKSEPEWSREKTAEALGLSYRDLNERIFVAEEMKVNPKIATIQNLTTAQSFVRRTIERRGAAETGSLDVFGKTDKPESILNESFLEWAPLYQGPKFNFLHCDFPYGISADNMNQGTSRAEFGDYADDEGLYWKLLDCLAKNLDTFCEPTAHLMFWFSMKFYTETVAFLRSNTDFVIDDFPLFWVKDIGLLPDPQRGPRRVYETALFGHRGDRKIVSAVANAITAPVGDRIHMSQKPVPVLEKFFTMIVDGSTLMLDPTCGSAAALIAAEAKGAKTVLGLEINKEFAGKAREHLEKARGLRGVVNV